MSIDSSLGGLQSLGNTLSTGVNSIGRAGADLGLNDLSSGGSNWKDRLRPASYRGVRFGVLGGEVKFGRRNAVHEYPFRDGVWVEDMGRMGRAINMAGFLVGDDCIEQRDRLIAACEQLGDGELVHPTLGRRVVALLECSSSETWDRGRVFEVRLSFVEQGKRIFPTVEASTIATVSVVGHRASTAASTDFLATVGGTLKAGLAGANQAISTVQIWGRAAQRLVNDATNLYHFVQSLPGSFGRIFGANIAPASQAGTSVAALIGEGAAARASVGSVGSKAVTAAKGLIVVAGGAVAAEAVGTALATYAGAAQALAHAVSVSTISPADSLRVLTNLIGAAPALPPTLSAPTYPVPSLVSMSPAMASALMAGASSDLFRRAAVIELAMASSSYTPTSYDDGIAVLGLVAGLLDAEIEVAGNQGQDATFGALRDLKTAVVQDLTARGASLAPLTQVALSQSLPAQVVAQRLYRDASRADELVSETNPIHPAFMPTTFKALSQ